MKRTFFARTYVWLAISFLLSLSSSTAQTIELAVRQKVDIPLTAGVVHPSPSGRFVLCAQLEKFEDSDQPTVRLVAVDRKGSKVLSKVDFPAGSYRFAASEEYAFVAKNDEKKLDILRLSDLSLQTSIPLKAAVDELLIANDRILFSNDGSIRLDLKTLQPSEEWSPPDTPLPIRRYYDGWLIDGVLWSEDLTKPKMICVIEFLDGAANPDSAFRSNTPWLQKRTSPFNSYEHPMMAAFQTDQEGKRFFSIRDLVGNEVAKCIAGSPRKTQVESLLSQKLTSFADPNGIEFFAFSGKVGMAICDGELQIWDLRTIDYSKLRTPFLAQRIQSTWTAPFGEPTVLKHVANQDYSGEFQMTSDKIEATTNASGDCTFDLHHWVAVVRKRNVDDYIAQRAPLDLNLKVPGLVKRLKLDPSYSYFADPIRVALRDGESKGLNSSIQYYILTSIPKERIKESSQASKTREDRRFAASQKEGEKQAKEEAALAEQKKKEEEAAELRSRAFSYYRIATRWAIMLAISLAICAPFWFWGRSNDSRQRKLSVLSMSIVGTLPLMGCVYWYAAFLTRWSDGKGIDAVTSITFLPAATLASMVFVFSLATVIRTLLRRSIELPID